MSHTSRITALRLAAGAVLMAAATLPAHAGVSVGVDIGLPIAGGTVGYGAYPVGAVGVRYGGHYGYRRGWGWGGWGVVVGAPWVVPGVVVAQPSTVIVEPAPQAAAALPQPPSKPEPVIYPRNGQSPQQLEADRQECNRWATTQQAALADSNVFMRAVDACMDARGYTTK